jgi:AcrR family transcriptional regulator
MAAVTQAPRLYRGISASERRARRRELLLEAGLEVFGTDGYAGSSVRAISAAASLNSRYFYESFASREELLYEVYTTVLKEISLEVIDATAQAGTVEEQAREGLRAAWTIIMEDRRKAKVIAVEILGVSERLERARQTAMHAFADIVANNAKRLASKGIRLRMDPVLTARALMGAVVELQVDWVNGEVDASLDEIVEHFTRMFTAVAYAAVEDRPGRTPGKGK